MMCDSIRRGKSPPTRGATQEAGVAIDFDLGEEVWRLAATSFAAYTVRCQSGGGSPKRLLVDFIIALHPLLKADRLMTPTRADMAWTFRRYG